MLKRHCQFFFTFFLQHCEFTLVHIPHVSPVHVSLSTFYLNFIHGLAKNQQDKIRIKVKLNYPIKFNLDFILSKNYIIQILLKSSRFLTSIILGVKRQKILGDIQVFFLFTSKTFNPL